MKYSISWYGQQICVGLLESEGAEEEINFAHNLFGAYTNTYLFHGAINFKSQKHFKRFLILKEFLPNQIKYPNMNKRHLFKRAVAKAQKTMKENVTYENFMQQITTSNRYYSVSERTMNWDNPEGH